MSDIDALVEAARGASFTQGDRNEQRRSFAYGSANIENARITRDTVIRAEELLKEQLRTENTK